MLKWTNENYPIYLFLGLLALGLMASSLFCCFMNIVIRSKFMKLGSYLFHEVFCLFLIGLFHAHSLRVDQDVSIWAIGIVGEFLLGPISLFWVYWWKQTGNFFEEVALSEDVEEVNLPMPREMKWQGKETVAAVEEKMERNLIPHWKAKLLNMEKFIPKVHDDEESQLTESDVTSVAYSNIEMVKMKNSLCIDENNPFSDVPSQVVETLSQLKIKNSVKPEFEIVSVENHESMIPRSSSSSNIDYNYDVDPTDAGTEYDEFTLGSDGDSVCTVEDVSLGIDSKIAPTFPPFVQPMESDRRPVPKREKETYVIGNILLKVSMCSLFCLLSGVYFCSIGLTSYVTSTYIDWMLPEGIILWNVVCTTIYLIIAQWLFLRIEFGSSTFLLLGLFRNSIFGLIIFVITISGIIVFSIFASSMNVALIIVLIISLTICLLLSLYCFTCINIFQTFNVLLNQVSGVQELRFPFLFNGFWFVLQAIVMIVCVCLIFKETADYTEKDRNRFIHALSVSIGTHIMIQMVSELLFVYVMEQMIYLLWKRI